MEDFDARDQVVRVIRELDHFVGGRPVNVQPLGAAEVHGDRGRFRQIIRNLITNAFRYGGPDVRVDVFEKDGRAVVQVSDDGEGIPESEWHRIFEPYERSLTGQLHKESMGIGLTVSRKLARLMGGELSYRFEYGRSVFELSLQPAVNAPALPGPVEPIEIQEPAARRSA